MLLYRLVSPSNTAQHPLKHTIVGVVPRRAIYSKLNSFKERAIFLDNRSHGLRKPVVDYWSDQPADIRAITDKDAFNAACSTIANAETIITQGEIKNAFNKYYNYAVYAYDTSDDNIMNTRKAMSLLRAYNAKYNGLSKSDNGSRIGYFTAAPTNDELQVIFNPILAEFTPGMSDREKAEICVQEIVDRFDYEVGGGFSWENGKTTGDCNDYANATMEVLQAAGIPNIGIITADTANGAHGWVQALIDGEWVVIDASAVENGYPVIMSFAEHARACGYDVSLNDTGSANIARALIEAAGK